MGLLTVQYKILYVSEPKIRQSFPSQQMFYVQTSGMLFKSEKEHLTAVAQRSQFQLFTYLILLSPKATLHYEVENKYRKTKPNNWPFVQVFRVLLVMCCHINTSLFKYSDNLIVLRYLKERST